MAVSSSETGKYAALSRYYMRIIWSWTIFVASVGEVKTLLGELEVLRQRAARAPVINTREQRNRWRRLTGALLPPEV